MLFRKLAYIGQRGKQPNVLLISELAVPCEGTGKKSDKTRALKKSPVQSLACSQVET